MLLGLPAAVDHRYEGRFKANVTQYKSSHCCLALFWGYKLYRFRMGLNLYDYLLRTERLTASGRATHQKRNQTNPLVPLLDRPKQDGKRNGTLDWLDDLEAEVDALLVAASVDNLSDTEVVGWGSKVSMVFCVWSSQQRWPNLLYSAQFLCHTAVPPHSANLDQQLKCSEIASWVRIAITQLLLAAVVAYVLEPSCWL